MSRTRKAKTTFRWYRWYIKHHKAKQQRQQSKRRIERGVMQKDDVWIIPDETDSLISWYYPDIYKQIYP